MEGLMNVMKNLPTASVYATRSNYRRHVMLKTAVIILAILGAIFSLINFQRGLIFFTIMEGGVFVFCLVLLYLLRRPKLLSPLSFIFVLVTYSFGLTLFGTPGTHPSVFIWIALGPAVAFFLLGKRAGIFIGIPFLSLATFLFLWTHLSEPNMMPLVAFANVIISMFSYFILAWFYEITRAETEEALVKDIAEKEQTEKEKEQIIHRLENALAQIKVLSGLLPICAVCKKIRDDQGYWKQIESYIHEHSEVQFSHSICPECAKKIYPNFSGER